VAVAAPVDRPLVPVAGGGTPRPAFDTVAVSFVVTPIPLPAGVEVCGSCVAVPAGPTAAGSPV
jgi:hypothetical protein